ncbi:MAG TPA: hypothetical protein VNT27_09690 [Propionibacteriaceae bacterium]|nr:hypothetical protein [Propionibacteriaceae bacterium]
MDVPTALLLHVSELASSIGLETRVLHVPLKALVDNLRAAVTSYRGLQLTIVHSGQPVTLTDLLPTEADGTALTSLRVPLSAVDPDHDGGSHVVFYAGTPGALVDLAADLAYVLKTSVIPATAGSQLVDTNGDDRARPWQLQVAAYLVLDADVPLSTSISGLTGLSELSAVNRAVGFLIDQGHDLDHAHDRLRWGAITAGVEVHVYAARMLGR